MAIQTLKRELKNSAGETVTVESSTFPARSGVRLSARLMGILASFLSVIPEGSSNKKEKDIANLETSFLDTDINFEQLSMLLVKHFDEERILDLILDLVEFTRVDGKEIGDNGIFDNVFSAEYGLLIQVLKFILEVNFTSFFGTKVIGKIRSLMQKVPMTWMKK